MGQDPPLKLEGEEASKIIEIQRWQPLPPKEEPEPDQSAPPVDPAADQPIVAAEDEIYTVLVKPEPGTELAQHGWGMEIELRSEDIQIVWAVVPWAEASKEARERMETG